MTRTEWAEGKARALRDQAAALRRQGFGDGYVRAARKGEAIRRLESRALRFERLARRLAPVEPFDLPF